MRLPLSAHLAFWYRRDGVSVPIWPKGQIGTLTPSPLYHFRGSLLVS
ncbi:MAG: hypothetical protein FWE41_07460 [Coriobacteriia bacterium]|nr:hypothetical protein [Coriobacteriia bacterium]